MSHRNKYNYENRYYENRYYENEYYNKYQKYKQKYKQMCRELGRYELKGVGVGQSGGAERGELTCVEFGSDGSPIERGIVLDELAGFRNLRCYHVLYRSSFDNQLARIYVPQQNCTVVPCDLDAELLRVANSYWRNEDSLERLIPDISVGCQ